MRAIVNRPGPDPAGRGAVALRAPATWGAPDRDASRAAIRRPEQLGHTHLTLQTTVKRTDLRSGILSQGTKVLAFCRDTINLTDARLESVVKGDVRAPRAELTCLEADGTDGRKRQEQLGALRAKPEWLPARKP